MCRDAREHCSPGIVLSRTSPQVSVCGKRRRSVPPNGQSRPGRQHGGHEPSTSRARPTLGDGGRRTHSSVSAPTPRLTPRQLPRLPLASKSGHVTPRGGSSAARGHTHRRQRLRGSRSTRSRPWAGQGQPRLRVGINTRWEGQRGFTEPRKVFGTTSGRSEVTGGAQAGTRREAG